MPELNSTFFFAAPLLDRLAQDLKTAQQPFSAVVKKAQPPQKLHMTLAWMGHQKLDKRRVQQLTTPLLQPFVVAISLTHIGAGISAKQLWAYVQPSNPLIGLHDQLLQRIQQSGLEIPADNRQREFVPHITLASLDTKVGLVADQPVSLSFTVEEVVLYESKQKGESTIYTQRGVVPLTSTEVATQR